MGQDERREAVERAAARVALLNGERGDDFQDLAAMELRHVVGLFRDEEDELPTPGEDPLLDAVREIDRSLDASQEAIVSACDAAHEAARASQVARR